MLNFDIDPLKGWGARSTQFQFLNIERPQNYTIE